MTDVRKIPWRLPEGYEDLKAFWDNFIKVIGENINERVFTGTGDPEGVVTADAGTLFLRTDGGAGTTLYVKESGTSNTGWVGK